MAKKKKSKESNSNNTYSVEMTGLILILIGIIGFGFGIIGSLIKKFTMFLAGTWWMIILISLIILGTYMIYKRKMPKFSNQKLIGLYIFLVVLLVGSHFEFLNLTNSPKDIILETYKNYMERISSITATNALNTTGTTSVVIGGGFIGAIFIAGLDALFGKTGTIVILVLLGIFASVLTFNVNLSDILRKIFSIFKRKPKKASSENEEVPISNSADVEVMSEVKSVPTPSHEKIIITSMDELKTKPVIEEIAVKDTENITPEDDESDYRLPRSSEIFDPLKPKKNNNTSFTQSNKEILERVLKDFGIAAKVVEIHIGPAVTEYELTVPPATKVSRILNIDKEIALALAAKDVIIQAPIPGKSTIGIEIPNPSISSVTLREVLESPQNLKSDSKIIKENKNTKDAAWFKIDCVPNLAFKHNEIMNEALEKLKSLITESNILKSILPDNFTMPELQKVFESILQKKFDRRNFRKKILSLNIVEDLNKELSLNGNKPSKLYKFKDEIPVKKVF